MSDDKERQYQFDDERLSSLPSHQRAAIEAKSMAARWPDLSDIVDGLRPIKTRKQSRILAYLAACYLFMDENKKFNYDIENDRTRLLSELSETLEALTDWKVRAQMREQGLNIEGWQEKIERVFKGLPNCNCLIPLLLSHRVARLFELDSKLIEEGFRQKVLFEPYENLAPMSEDVKAEFAELQEAVFSSYGPKDYLRGISKAEAGDYSEAVGKSLGAGADLVRALLIATSVVRAGYRVHPVLLDSLIGPLESYLKEEFSKARNETIRAFDLAGNRGKKMTDVQKNSCKVFVLYHVHGWSKKKVLSEFPDSQNGSDPWGDLCQGPWEVNFLTFLNAWSPYEPDFFNPGKYIKMNERSIAGLFAMHNGANSLPTLEEVRRYWKRRSRLRRGQ